MGGERGTRLQEQELGQRDGGEHSLTTNDHLIHIFLQICATDEDRRKEADPDVLRKCLILTRVGLMHGTGFMPSWRALTLVMVISMPRISRAM